MSSEQSSEYVIEVNGLGKCYQIYNKPSDRLKQMLMCGRKQYYKEFWALKDVSFNIKKGETVGVIGRNGSGKSTLLQMICGTLNPTEGEVKINGRVAALLELGAGFNPEFSGVENVYMASSLYGLTKADVEQRFEEIAAFADIGDHLHQPVKTYSSGMYVRLAFAVIAHVDADILVIDEALAVGDAFFTQKCMRFLRGFMKQGTVVFVSHDTGAVINLCNMVVWIDRGEIKANGEPKAISEGYLSSLYENNQKQINKSCKIEHKNDNKVFFQNDPRWDLINYSDLRNTLHIFKFKEFESNEFGRRKAKIIQVKLLNDVGENIIQCTGGEIVELEISIEALEDICQPIVGLSFKDRLGQVLFGDNTYLTYSEQVLKINSKTKFLAKFKFQLPILPQGEYCIATAIATGTQFEHEQEHWIHDAIVVRSISSSVSTGLVGIPMHSICIERKQQY